MPPRRPGSIGNTIDLVLSLRFAGKAGLCRTRPSINCSGSAMPPLSRTSGLARFSPGSRTARSPAPPQSHSERTTALKSEVGLMKDRDCGSRKPPNRVRNSPQAGAAPIWWSPRRRLTLPARPPSDISTLQSKGHLNFVATAARIVEFWQGSCQRQVAHPV